MDTKNIEKIVEKMEVLLAELKLAFVSENGSEAIKEESNKEETIHKILNGKTSNILVSSNTSINNNNNKTLTSKNSLISCTPDEIWEIAKLLHISEKDVFRKHESIMDMIKIKEFQKTYRKHKTVFYTLKKWLGMDLDKGYLQELDQDSYSILLENNPEKRAAHERFIKKAKLLGVL